MIHVYLSTACFHAVHDDRPDLHTWSANWASSTTPER